MKIIITAMIALYSINSFSEETVIGPWIKGKRYDYRYVTHYNIERVKRPMRNLPWIEEDCHDSGNRFANWSKTISYSLSYRGGLNFSLLGFLEIDLGAERSKTIDFTFQRWVTPTDGIRARHRLFEEFENWKGETQIEYRYPDQLIERGEKTYPFSLSNASYGISVEREIIQVCD